MLHLKNSTARIAGSIVVVLAAVVLIAKLCVREPAQQPRSLRTLRGHSGILREVAFSPDGQTLATSSVDGTVTLWRKKKAISYAS